MAVFRKRATWFVGLVSLVSAAHAGSLSMQERIEAQEKIERIYYAHQMGATAPFERAVSRDLLETKVRSYLSQSVALENRWHTEITPDMLERELSRMAAGSRLPDRLRELFAALGDDPLLIAECLARPALADRLSRRFFASDPAIHAAARAEAERLRDEIDARGTDSLRGDSRAREAEVRQTELGRSLPRSAGAPARIVERPDAFEVNALLEERPGAVRALTLTIEKVSWDAWWSAARSSFDPSEAREVAGSLAIPDLTSSVASGCVPDDTWDNASLDDGPPDGRRDHVAVWTGSVMLVWGGLSQGALDDGSRYDPATDTWSPMSASGAPAARSGAVAVWTGSRMVVWGGIGSGGRLQSGGRYDPASDSWEGVSTSGAPSARSAATAVWTGARMVVWGGADVSGLALATGGRYDPATDTWTATSIAGAPSARFTTAGVWTGSRMVVWGGMGPSFGSLNTGGRYDPVADTWASTSLTGVPFDRYSHVGVWTGSTMVVWGGFSSSRGGNVSTGGRYDPAADTWSATATAGAPSSRRAAVAAWTGTEMILWGGLGSGPTPLVTGGRYTPATNTWTSVATTGAPSPRQSPTAIWTGSSMVVWGGYDVDDVNLASGARYAPMTNTWTPTSSSGSGPTARASTTAVWTGAQMIVWGGDSSFSSGGSLSTGGRYDPATDTWTPTSLLNAPPAVGGHTAVWTGSRMIVWGGYEYGVGYKDTGGRYDPIADAWSATSLNAPSRRNSHTAVWTGSSMIVWGGYDGNVDLATGGRYDPSTDTWSGVSLAGAPAGRSRHSGVWTGTRLLVWGGEPITNTGGAYDPATDTWTSLASASAPTARSLHVAVWTGSRMLVWGGLTASGETSTGGSFDPVANSWTALAQTGAPSARVFAAAFWSGEAMIVWGGTKSPSTFPGAGGRYDPSTDTWLPTSESAAPSGRYLHAATWTGSSLIVWGGYNGAFLANGGRYALGQIVDGDGDGLAACQGDCNDTDGSIHPGAAEICDGVDNDCSLAVDDDASGVDSDADGVHNACDVCVFGYDPPQSDFDLDGEGDRCDLDDGLIYQLAPDRETLEWQAEGGAGLFNVYEGDLAVLRDTGIYTQAPGSNPLAARICGIGGTSVADPSDPDPGSVMFALVTAVVNGVETSLGEDSFGVERPNTNPCP